MFLANFIFVVSHLKIHPVVHLNTSKALTSLYSKRNVYWKFTSFRFSYILTRVEKDKMVAKNHSKITLVNKSNLLLFITISWHIESPGYSQNSLLTHFQAYSGTFSNIKPCSGILRDIKAYWGIFWHYWGVWSHSNTYSELCVTLAYTTITHNPNCVTLAYTTVPYSEPWLN